MEKKYKKEKILFKHLVEKGRIIIGYKVFYF